jgi:hypothetical protein
MPSPTPWRPATPGSGRDQIGQGNPQRPLLDERATDGDLGDTTMAAAHNHADEPAGATPTGVPPLHLITRGERAESELIHRLAS